MKKLIIVGTGLSAKQVYDFVNFHKLYEIVGFAVNEKYKNTDKFCELPVYTLETIREELNIFNIDFFISLGWNYLNSQKRALYEKLKKSGFCFTNLISPHAVIKGIIDGENIWVNDYSVIQSDAIIKSNATLREGVIIGNGTIIKEHCFIGIHAVIGGNSIIGTQTFIGMRGTVFDGTKVGEKCLIGACAVVKRHLPSYCACKTSSNDMVIKQYDSDTIENKLIAGHGVR